MSGLTAHEWVRATIVADVFHWGVVGLLMLAGLLVQRWLARRALRRQGSIPVVPAPWRSPDRICPDCHAHHYCHAAPLRVPPQGVEK